MRNYQDTFPVDQMAKALGVSRSGYYDFIDRKPSSRDLYNKTLILRIKGIYEESFQTYGSPRIHALLQEEGFRCSRPKIARLMKKEGIHAKMHKKFKKRLPRSLCK